MKLFGNRAGVAFLVCLAMSSFVQQGIGRLLAPFWDYHVYVHALDQLRAGANPYDMQALPFVYPPIFLNLFGHVPFAPLYALFVAASLVYAAWRFGKTHFWPVALLGFFLGGTGAGGIITGNFATFAHLLVIALFYSASQDENRAPLKYALLSFLVFLFASIKIYFFAYAFVFLFVPKGMRYFLFAACGVALAGVGQLVLEPQLWSAFKTMLRYQIIVRNDGGDGLPGYLQHYAPALPATADVLLHELIVLALFVYAIGPFGAPRVIPFRDVSGKLFYLLALAILLNPRIKTYDFGPFSACCFISLFLNADGDSKRERLLFFALPVGLIVVWVLARFARWFVLLDVVWLLTVYLLFALASVRQRAQRVSRAPGAMNPDLTVAP